MATHGSHADPLAIDVPANAVAARDRDNRGKSSLVCLRSRNRASRVRPSTSFIAKNGRPLSLPAFQPVETYPVYVEDGMVKVEVA